MDFDCKPLSPTDSAKIEEIAAHYREIIRLVGENPDREGLQKTPMRAARAMWFATQGYRTDPAAVLSEAIFEYAGSRMVVVKDIEFYSFCEHHILPFFGTVSIGYIPDGSMIGLSKLARVVNAVARRLQVQERLTAELCDAIEEALAPKGVIVACNAHHLCMKMRGVEKQLATTDTYDYRGDFASDTALRREFLDLIGR
ncbi:MAG: GTP cyclohydrolase I FolE [Muribaculaceae bacterium]|nr:GTP cyclohydrolase I FolE [Muribaculaceae bacterium]